MENLRQARGQPLRLRGQHLLPNLFLKAQGRVGPRLAQPSSLCISPDRPDPADDQANQGTEAQSSVSGPALEEPALVCGAVSAAHYSPVVHSPEMRPPLSGERNDLAPPARNKGALASRWVPLDLPESVLNIISQARAPSTRRLYAFKWSVFSAWFTTLLPSARLPSTIVGPFGPLLVPKESSSVGRSPIIDTVGLYWFP